VKEKGNEDVHAVHSVAPLRPSPERGAAPRTE
jgi:hypothetical protein